MIIPKGRCQEGDARGVQRQDEEQWPEPKPREVSHQHEKELLNNEDGNRLFREAGESPSLEVFQPHLCVFLCHLL